MPGTSSRRTFLRWATVSSLLTSTSLLAAARHSRTVEPTDGRRQRRLYLRRLEQSVQATLSSGAELSDRQRFLGGLLSIERLYVIDDDIVLEGPAVDKWRLFQGHTALAEPGAQTPLLCLDDLVIALRNVYHGNPPPLLSLEPRRESLQAVRNVLRRFGLPRNRAAVRELEHEIRRVWGKQDAVLEGVPRQTRFALVMTYADWEMKRLSLGLRRAPGVELQAYVDMEFQDYVSAVRTHGPRAKPPALGSRFWFMASDEPFVRSVDHRAYRFPRRPLQLATEGYFRSKTFQRVDVQPTPAARRFAAEFTACFDKLAGQLAVFHDLRNLFHLVALAKLLQKLRLPEQLNWDLSFWLERYPVRAVAAPRQMPGLAVVRWDEVRLDDGRTTARLFFPAWGGVQIDPVL